MRKRVLWRDYLNLFLKIPVEKRKLPIIIGGESKLYDFYGFNTIGYKKTSFPMHGEEVIRILQELSEEELSLEVPNGEFIADKFGIGINKTCFIYSTQLKGNNKITTCSDYEIIQDYLGETYGNVPDDEEALEEYKSRSYKLSYSGELEKMVSLQFINPGERIIIETIDGASLLEDDEYLN